MRVVSSVLILGLACRVARADDPVSPHLFYGELLGKAGEYGVGYELTITPRLAVGAAGSFAVIRGQQIATIAPYVHGTVLSRGHHAMFVELGPVLTHSKIPSPVADWNGMSATGGGGFGSVGYEHATRHLVMRATGSAVVGEGGLAPALGFSIGFRP